MAEGRSSTCPPGHRSRAIDPYRLRRLQGGREHADHVRASGYGKQGVRVNTIVPGLIITDAVRAHLTESMLEGLGRAILVPPPGEPEDIANLVLFLASDESRYITGQMIAIDGGMSAHVGSGGGND